MTVRNLKAAKKKRKTLPTSVKQFVSRFDNLVIQSPKRNSHALSGWDGFSLTTLDIRKPSPAPCWKAPSIRTIRYFGGSIDRLRAPYGLWSAVEHEGT
jgi:hypothetical protein